MSFLETYFATNPTKLTNAVIFTDSKSALQALENSCTRSQEVLHTLLLSSRLLTTYPIRLVLQWIPGHTNIPGNERADRLAKKGSQLEQPNKPASIKTAKQIISHNYKEEWMNMWSTGTTGRAVYQHMTTTKPNDNIRSLNRKEQTAIFRLRTQHVPLNQHLNRIKPPHPTACPLCNHPNETTKHFLLECRGLQDLKQQLLPPTPDIDNTLYSTTEQLKKTAQYYHMALGRRAMTQRPLG